MRLKHSRSAALLSLIIAIILIIAAISKISAPQERFPDVDYVVGIFEIALACALLAFFSHWEMWITVILVFFSWAGFAFFWVLWEAPCTCFGSEIALHPGISLTIDLAFITSSAWIAKILGAKRLVTFFGYGLLLSLLGFLIAYSIYI